jgi:hypothetical protein
MPTGYTYKLIDEDQSFEDFALHCMTAFGACIEQRDSNDTKPKLRKIDTYHYDELKEATKELGDFLNKSDEEIQKEIDDQYQEDVEYYKTQKEKNKKIKIKLLEIKERIHKLNFPEGDYAHYKEFMLEQIDRTIEHDCSDRYENEPVKPSLKEYKNSKIESYNWNINYHKDSWEKHQKNVEDSNRWIRGATRAIGVKIEE